MQVGKLHRLYRDFLSEKRKETMKDNPNSSFGNFGIKYNPLKNPKKPRGEERKKGQKPQKQVLDENGLLS